MSTKTQYARIQLRRDTHSRWLQNNPTLLDGEFAWSSDQASFKIGDGATAWASLPYFGASGLSKETGTWQRDAQGNPRWYWGASTTDAQILLRASHSSGYFQLRDPDNNTAFSVNMTTGVLHNGVIPWARLSDVPSTFPPSSHNHDASYLKLSGGTMTGSVYFPDGASIYNSDSYILLGYNSSLGTGTTLASNQGITRIRSSSDTNLVHRVGSNEYPILSTGNWNSYITWSTLPGKPSSMPASDVYAWAKASTKPSYDYTEITPVRIPDGADLNNYSIPGFYWNPSNAEVGRMTNTPYSHAFSLLVEKHAGVKQTFTVYGASDISTWVRNFYNGTWGPWNRVFLSDGSALTISGKTYANLQAEFAPKTHDHSGTTSTGAWTTHTTQHGNIQLGPATTSYNHIYGSLDKPFYMNRALLVDDGKPVLHSDNWSTYVKWSTLSGAPSSLPASDVYAWAKAATKPTYTASEVGAAASSHTHSYLPLAGGALTGNVTQSSSASIQAGSFARLTSWANQLDGKAYNWHIYLDGTNATLGYTNGEGVRTIYTLTHSHPYAASSHTHTKANITDFPTSMPASDVSAWAKASTKPSYTASEVGAAASSHTHSYVPQLSSISGASHSAAIKTWFDNNKASIPRNQLISAYSSAMSNGSIVTGYFLSGYDTAPYGGFFVGHYDRAWYVGISNGTYSEQQLLTSTNYTTYTVTKTGGGASGSWNITSADSSKLSGQSADTAGTANTIALRDSSGDIRARLFRCDRAIETFAGTYQIAHRRSTSDDYIRFAATTDDALRRALAPVRLTSGTSYPTSGVALGDVHVYG